MHEIRKTFIKGEEIRVKYRIHLDNTIEHEAVVSSTATHRLTKGLSFAERYGARLLLEVHLARKLRTIDR